MKIIKKVALANFKDEQSSRASRTKKILLVRSKSQPEVFYTLGGKYEEGESDIECLKREVKEEIGCEIDEKSLKFLNVFEDVAHGGKGRLNIRMYQGNLIGDPKPTSEIVEIGYFNTKSNKKNLSEIAQRTIFPWLKKHGYIE